jgi:hypothetical protein
MFFKMNFYHQFSPIKFKLYAIKGIPLENTFEYESNDIFFILYILFFVGQNY